MAGFMPEMESGDAGEFERDAARLDFTQGRVGSSLSRWCDDGRVEAINNRTVRGGRGALADAEGDERARGQDKPDGFHKPVHGLTNR